MTMKEKVHAYIKKHQMIKAGDSVLVGVSGGADSLALLHFLSQSREDLGIGLGVAHLHHGMRGSVADGDAAFVEAMCRSLDVPFYGGFADVPALAREEKVGVEVAGRQARYAFFREIMDKKGFTRLATAHHLDDQAETVLMRLIRGTGMVGAAGIPAVDGEKIRPLLCVTREEIEAYCKVYRLDYRHDCTNDDHTMTRNRLRHDIIPQLKTINPQVAKHLAVFAEEALDYEAVVQDQVALWGNQHFVIGADGWLYYNLECFLREPPFIQSKLLRAAILEATGTLMDIGRVHIEKACTFLSEKIGNGEIQLPRGIVVRKDYQRVLVGIPEAQEDIVSVEEVSISTERPGVYELNGYRFTVDVMLLQDLKMLQKKKISSEIFIDYGKIKDNLVLRTRKAGDVIALPGMQGRKKIKSFYIDRKLPRAERDRLPLLAMDEEVLWVPGYAVSRNLGPEGGLPKILWMKMEKV